MEKLAKVFLKKHDAKILDVGTGNGNFIKIITALTDDFSEIIGIDLSRASIESCEKNFEDKRINFFQMDALEMDFDGHLFDFVCLSNSLHHLNNIKEVFSEMERVLKVDGEIIICEMMSDKLTNKQRSHLLLHHYAAEVDRFRGKFHAPTFTKQEIIRNIEENTTLTIIDKWDLKYPEKETISQIETQWLYETIDRVKESVKDTKKKVYFEKGADKVKKHINKYGFDSATQLIVVLR